MAETLEKQLIHEHEVDEWFIFIVELRSRRLNTFCRNSPKYSNIQDYLHGLTLDKYCFYVINITKSSFSLVIRHFKNADPNL